MNEGMRYRCINHSNLHKDCVLFFTSGLLINKEDLIKKCDGFKKPVDCCWYKDMDYAHYT